MASKLFHPRSTRSGCKKKFGASDSPPPHPDHARHGAMAQRMELGQTYTLNDAAGHRRRFRFLHFNARSNKYTVRDMERASSGTMRIQMKDFSMARRVPSNTGAIHNNTQLYILKTGAGIYKIGCTDDLEARMRAGKTWCSHMSKVATRAIPCHKSRDWRRYERKVHRRFSKNRCEAGGCEVFKFTNAQASDAAGYLARLRFD